MKIIKYYIIMIMDEVQVHPKKITTIMFSKQVNH
jgi:hypothetical protein